MEQSVTGSILRQRKSDMEKTVKFFTQVDQEAGIASLTLFLYGEGSARIAFQGEERVTELKKEGVREDFFILSIRLWDGKKSPELYSIEIDGEEYNFGLRSFGLDKERGFFLNGERYLLYGENTLITESLSDLDRCDKEGIVAAFIFPPSFIPTSDEVASLSSHPSLFFWGYRVEKESEEELRRLNSILYSLDKTRATIGVFNTPQAPSSIFDVNIVNEEPEEKRRVVALMDGDGFKL